MRSHTRQTQKAAVVAAYLEGQDREGAAVAAMATAGLVRYWELSDPQFRQDCEEARQLFALRAGKVFDDSLVACAEGMVHTALHSENEALAFKAKETIVKGRGVLVPLAEHQVEVTERRVTFVFVLPDGTKMEPGQTR